MKKVGASLLWVFLAVPQEIEVEGQPLAANAERVLQALEALGAPVPQAARAALKDAGQDGKKVQQALDPHVAFVATVARDGRAKTANGPAVSALLQGAWTPALVKVVNEAGTTKSLRITSPQSGLVYSGGRAGNVKSDPARFLQVDMHASQPLTPNLSGLRVEYAVALLYASEPGKREASIGFEAGAGGGEVPVSLEIRPGIQVKLSIRDFDGKPTAGRFTFRDKAGRVYPPQAKRLAPDFFFQEQVYRHDGGTAILPPGDLTMEYGRGPEYRLLKKQVTIPDREASIEVKVERWVNPMEYGFYSGDHHIHAAGCAHYTNPTEGVHAADMFLHVKGEGLNVGCNLTWGPCYEYQRQFFEPGAHKLSEPLTVLKYDVEVSGFGSQALGHVCLLNLKDQTYPGSDGTKTKGWPTWTTPLMKWAKAQGATTGYAHSAIGLGVNPSQAAQRLLNELDGDRDGRVSAGEAEKGLLPEAFAAIDGDGDKGLALAEMQASIGRAANRLPNLAIPQMDGIGAQEICVTSAQGICDFISAMNTARVPEWNCWYHIMNCGFPLKVSGETDFPCVSGGRVGEGRVYVQLGKIDRIDYAKWCEGLAKGRSYVSDGYAHALEFSVNGKRPGEAAALDAPGTAGVKALVAFASEIALGTAKGGNVSGNKRLVEIVVNGQAVASKEVAADDKEHDLAFDVKVDRSSWVALRCFPQLHTNPVNVIVGGKPIRASRRSALWCVGVIEQLWRVRGPGIAAHERGEAKKTFDWAIGEYRRIAAESPE